MYLTETKCKMYVRFNCKWKKWGKKWVAKSAIKGGRGGVWRLVAKVLKIATFWALPLVFVFMKFPSQKWLKRAENYSKKTFVLGLESFSPPLRTKIVGI